MFRPNIFKIVFLVIDLFCGAGGVSTGFVNAKGTALVIACVNHDHTAILSHKCNHPDTHHFEEDIRTLDITPLKDILRRYQKLYPQAKSVLWGSLECQGVSRAAGGQAKNAYSRTLYTVFTERYVKELQTDYVMIENVVEFEDLGPTQIIVTDITLNEYGEEVWNLATRKDEHGKTIYGHKVIPECKGEFFKAFNDEICGEGYEKEWAKMNAADYGAFTSRLRLFGIFKRPGLPNVWPTKTHSKTGAGGLKKWNAVKSKIDFADEGYSVFNRSMRKDHPARFRKDIGDKSIRRIYEGFIKHVAGGKKAHEAYIVKYYSGKDKSRSSSLDEPLGTIPTENRFAVIRAMREGAAFLGTYNGTGDNTHSVNGVAPTIPAADTLYLASATTAFIDKHYSAGGTGAHQNSSIDDPLGTITKNDKNRLIQAKKGQRSQGDLFAFIDNTHFNNVPQGVEEPLGTITADRHFPMLLNPSHGGNTHDLESPCPTIIASQHKAPLYLLQVIGSEGGVVPVYDTDSEAVKLLKETIAMYGFSDIKMRMLKARELMIIQGFPEDYVLAGNQEEQKKHIGNSVEPNQVTQWALAIADELMKMAA